MSNPTDKILPDKILANHILAPMVRKLEKCSPLSASDREAILALPHRTRELRALEYIVREGDRPTHSCALLSGYAVRHKLAGDGGRQILSVHLLGDVLDLQNSLLGVADHNVHALSAATIALIPVEAIAEISDRCPAVAKALWRETLVESSIFREWIVNVGRRDARTRTAHLLCELALRVEAAGIAGTSQYELFMTQEQMADVLGLTSVHINRTLKSLEKEGLIGREKRSLTIVEWDALASAGDFDPAYLHLAGARPAEPLASAA